MSGQITRKNAIRDSKIPSAANLVIRLCLPERKNEATIRIMMEISSNITDSKGGEFKTIVK